MSPGVRWPAVVGLVGTILLAAACGQQDPAVQPVEDLAVGTCFQAPEESASVRQVEEVDCTLAHDHQVYAVVQLDGASFPGANAVQEVAFARCLDRYEAAVGTPYESSPVDVGLLLPTVDSWDEGDREVLCLLGDGDEPLQGSLLVDGA